MPVHGAIRMNPFHLDPSPSVLLALMIMMCGFLITIYLDMRYYFTHDGVLLLTIAGLAMVLFLGREGINLVDVFLGVLNLGMVMIVSRYLFGRKIGTGDCLLYPICGLAVGNSHIPIWIAFFIPLFMLVALTSAVARGKKLWPPARLYRTLGKSVFPGTPSAILAVFGTWLWQASV